MSDGLKIQCIDVQLCAAAWLDGQLSPAESEFLEEHLSQCPSCEELLNRMSEQPLSPPTLQVVQNDAYWRKMDEALAAELSKAQEGSNDHGVSWKSVGMYVAAILLIFLWGLHHQQRASTLEQMVEQQQRTLEHLERLATQPESPKTYVVPAKYVPAHLEL